MCYSIVRELCMIKHKYLILVNVILFIKITVLFSVYNSILLSTQETSCGNIWNCAYLMKLKYKCIWGEEGICQSSNS